MKTKIFISSFIFWCCSFLSLSAQIGYQVALLNTATGKPRAGETVNVTIEIGDKKSHLIWRETQTVTSNDFGILSLTVGNENTFKNANWTNLPFFIAVWVDNVLIGRTQILSVPLAEAAKGGAPAFPIEDLLGTWSGRIPGYSTYSVTFNEDGTYIINYGEDGEEHGYYFILGNYIFCAENNGSSSGYGSYTAHTFSISVFKNKTFCGGHYNGFTK